MKSSGVMSLKQEPPPGTKLVKMAGDLLVITLDSSPYSDGTAFVRTNYGGSKITGSELIANVEHGKPIQGRDWRDWPLEKVNNSLFRVSLPLAEVGLFEFKTCFVNAEGQHQWTDGYNLSVKVEPAVTYGNNTIYNAFVRQFGPNISGNFYNNDLKNAESFLNDRGYTVVPPSGTFADVRDKLAHVMDDMGFRIVMFLPVHPVPTTFAKMGRFGSPFAPLDFFMVDSSMAVFDRKTTPLEQFVSLIDAIHARDGLAFIDLPLDHTGWASAMQVEHPEWFERNDDGTFESPGAWGVVWADLCKLDFSNKQLWGRLAQVVLHWCRIGVDGFRCDAGYMIPADVWKYIIAKVREQYPDTVFLLEGLGGPLETTRHLLMDCGLNWAYSESFQQFGFMAESSYLKKTLESAVNTGFLVNFAETHDNKRLAETSEEWARLRVASAALLAPAGAFGIANGVEWLATEKIDVHGDSSLNWGAWRNIVDFISVINGILRCHPAFQAGANLRIPQSIAGECITLLRSSGDIQVMVIVNPNMDRPVSISWDMSEYNPGTLPFDIISGREILIRQIGDRLTLDLPPAFAGCLSQNIFTQNSSLSIYVRRQKLRAAVMRMLLAGGLKQNLEEDDIERLTSALARNSSDFMAAGSAFANIPMVEWRPLRDRHRIVMIPPSHVLYIRADSHFLAKVSFKGKTLEKQLAISRDDNEYFAVFTELCSLSNIETEYASVEVRLFPKDKSLYEPVLCKGELMLLPKSKNAQVNLLLPAERISSGETGLCTNNFGSYTLARASWGTIQSKYDGFLAVNLNKDFPDERRVMVTRFRSWIRHRDFANELDIKFQTNFQVSYDNTLTWNFIVPCGLGKSVAVQAVWTLDREANSGCLTFALDALGDNSEEDDIFTIIVRPDVDYRCNHCVTKAYTGPEHTFSNAVHKLIDGLQLVSKSGDILLLQSSDGKSHKVPEWKYQVPLPIEKERGLEDSMDVFSPGYFEFHMKPASSVSLSARAWRSSDAMPLPCKTKNNPGSALMPLGKALLQSIDYFVVTRNEHKSIIAGYPWFLDWGRDTLICLRGLIAAGYIDVAKDTICQFAQFESDGTLPNMIRGKDTSDRDTSDAPLWLFAAVKDLIEHPAGGKAILDMQCGKRSLVQVLESLASSLWNGAPNGVRVDVYSGLLFSPPHFTWMDTNYPAATPRTGYPIEIQALWINAMGLLSQIGYEKPWKERRDLAKKSLFRLFKRTDGKGLCDCLHSPVFVRADNAQPDDAIRPNQLLAVTLNAIDDNELTKSIIESCSQLLTPSGIRSLDDAPVTYPVPVSSNGKKLNDEYNPYFGQYTGPEDEKRKPAYHNGTSWAWQMPLFCEANHMAYGQAASASGLSLLLSAVSSMEKGCIGFLPEIYDGDAPHAGKGCVAQAWSMTEFLRIWLLLGGGAG